MTSVCITGEQSLIFFSIFGNFIFNLLQHANVVDNVDFLPKIGDISSFEMAGKCLRAYINLTKISCLMYCLCFTQSPSAAEAKEKSKFELRSLIHTEILM